MSARETALAALATRLATTLASMSPPPVVARNATIPQVIPAGGLVMLRDGETTNSTTMMSPLTYAIEHGAEVEVIARGATAAASQVRLDDLLVAVAGALITDRTLGGAVEWAEPGLPAFDDLTFDGAAPARTATVVVSLFFTVAASPLS